MQNLPVITAAPVASSQTPAATDSNPSAQSAEPFGNVLARQRANAAVPQDGKKADGKKAATSSSREATVDSTGKGAASTPQVPALDAASALSGNILAALLPATTISATAGGSSSTDSTIQQAPAPDGVNTLPGAMLAMLLPAATVPGSTVTPSGAADVVSGNIDAINKSFQEVMANPGKKAQPLPDATATLGDTLKTTGNKPATTGSEAGSATALISLGSAKQEVSAVDIGTIKGNTFTAILGAAGKDGSKPGQAESVTSKIAVQPVASAALDSLMQSGASSVAGNSANNPVQVLKTSINTPVTDQAWGNDFNQKVTWMATQNLQSAELHLNPPNLGPLDVVLKVSGDQATALFTSPHAAIRDIVEQALPHLRNMLADNGITLGNAMVSDQSAKDHQAWQAGQGQKGRGTSGSADATISAGSNSSTVTTLSSRRHQGMVDTFA